MTTTDTCSVLSLHPICGKITHVAQVKDFAELGARIRLFRQGANLDQETLARECASRGQHLDRTAISRIETGDRRVSALELSVLAEIVGVSFVDLVSAPEPSVLAARKPIAEESTSQEREDFLAGVEIDRAWRDLCQLRDYHLIEAVELPFGGHGLATREEARELAQKTRDFLKVGDAPLGSMTDVAAELGLWCRTTQVAVDGLSFSPEIGLGVALVGQGLDPGRRRATVAHEIGHHISGDTYETSNHFSSAGQAEEFIEVFAAELLLPSSVLEELRCPTRDDFVRLAAEYRVSWSLIVQSGDTAKVDLSKVERNTTPVDEDFYRAVGSKPEEDMVPPGLAKKWVQACVRAVDEDFISRRRAQEMTCGLVEAGDE